MRRRISSITKSPMTAIIKVGGCRRMKRSIMVGGPAGIASCILPMENLRGCADTKANRPELQTWRDVMRRRWRLGMKFGRTMLAFTRIQRHAYGGGGKV